MTFIKLIKQITGAKSSSTSLVKKTIDDVTIADYQRLVFDNDLQALVISGTFPDDELELLKSDILFAFMNASGAANINSSLVSFKIIHKIKIQIKILELCARIIAAGGTEDAYNVLKSIGVLVDHVNKESALKTISVRIKAMLVKYHEEINKYKSNTDEKESQFTRDDFEKQLAYISKETGYRIDRNTTSLREYAAYISNIKTIQKQQEDGRKYNLHNTRGTK